MSQLSRPNIAPSISSTCSSDLEKAADASPRTGSGTKDDPYVLDWDTSDREYPFNWPQSQKWIITTQLALASFTVSFSSSAYSGGLEYTMRDLKISYELAVLGISLYVLGFALGPLLFAPMSEMYGRRIIFLITLSLYTPLHLGGSLGRHVPTFLASRLFAGIFGSSPLSNAGGVIADIFPPSERGLASAIYAAVPFLGPIIGPIVGGFVAENHSMGWHFNFWLMFLFSLLSLVTTYFFAPETYPPILLRRRAGQLTKESSGNLLYISKHDKAISQSCLRAMTTHLRRPFVFLVAEPIVSLFSVYIAVVYGTLYALFCGYPIVFQAHRGWSAGQTGLAFLGVGFGILTGIITSSWQNRIYSQVAAKSPSGQAPPEARLHMAMMGAVLVPIGLFWFAWTSDPSIHWIVPIIAGFPFGMGICQILQSSTAYLMDAYGIYVASAVAATVVLRSCCGAVFPLISPALFSRLGDQWAMTVFASLSLLCTPIPFLFWKYGERIRARSHFALST